MKSLKITQKMLSYIDSILKYTSNITYNEFKNNSMMVVGCIFIFSQFGELAINLDIVYINEHYDIPWFKIKGLRNRIVHDYEGVNLNLIWEIIDVDIKILRKQLMKLIEQIDI